MRLLLLLPVLVSPAVAVEPVLTPARAADELKFNFQARVRAELRENVFDFDDSRDAATDDTWLLQRIRIGLEWQPAPWWRVTLQGQDVREFFSDRPDVPGVLGAEGDDAFDLRLAALEIGRPDRLSLKLGRQVLSYGDERLIGPLEWLNFSRTFDAARLHWQQERWWLDLFAASAVRIHESEFNVSDFIDSADHRNQCLSGIYFSTTLIPRHTADLYLLHLHEETRTGGTDFATLGTRWRHDPLPEAPWDYTVEIAAQAGQVVGQDLRAFASHLEAGYNWLTHPWKPRLACEYSYGSGDGNPADGELHTFQNLYPTNHPPYGLMDTFSWQNMHNLALRLSAQPHARVKATLDLHAFWLDDTADAWYRANGTTTVRPRTPGARSYAGSEADFTVSAKISDHLQTLLGYSHFFAGSYLDDTGAGDDADFAYFMVTLSY
jgi:hypothetical protein